MIEIAYMFPLYNQVVILSSYDMFWVNSLCLWIILNCLVHPWDQFSPDPQGYLGDQYIISR